MKYFENETLQKGPLPRRNAQSVLDIFFFLTENVGGFQIQERKHDGLW